MKKIKIKLTERKPKSLIIKFTDAKPLESYDIEVKCAGRKYKGKIRRILNGKR